MSQAAAPAATSTPGSSLLPDSTDVFTATHFILIALFAALVVAALVWGVRQKALRRSAEHEVREHNAEIDDAPAAASGDAPEQPMPPPQQPDMGPVGDPSPAVVAEPGPADGPVTQLKGLGPKVADRLAEHGITTVGQIAALTDDDAAALDAKLGAFAGRMARDRWQEQARFLAAGDRAGFEAVFGRL